MEYNLLDLIAALEEVVKKAAPFPIGKKSLVDCTEIDEIATEMRLVLPREIQQAQNIVADKNRIISDAKKEAEAIINKAEQQRRVLAHAFDLHQLFHGRFQHGMQGSEPVQQTMRQGIYVALGNGVKQHQLQHLVVCEALQPSGEEPLPHPLPVPGMLSSHTAPSSARL